MKKQLPIILAIAAAAVAYFLFFRKKGGTPPGARSGSSGVAAGSSLVPTPYNSPRGAQVLPARSAQPSLTNQLAQSGIQAGGNLLASLLKGVTGGGGGGGGGGSFGGGSSGGGSGTSSASSGGTGGSNITLTNVSADQLGLGDLGSSQNQTVSDTSGALASDSGVSSIDVPPTDLSSPDLGGELSTPADFSGGDFGGDSGP